MISPSIERLHHILDKQIKLAQAYNEISYLEFIIRSCRLKPFVYMFNRRPHKILLYSEWMDEFGNMLVIDKKKLGIIYNNIRLTPNKIVSTDLYFGLSLDKIVKMSKLAHLVAGKDEDLNQDCYLLTFLGLDDHWRSYLYLYSEWTQVSPLILGIKNLKLLYGNIKIKYYNDVEIKNDCMVPCKNPEAWLSYLPASEGFVEMIKNKYETLLPIFENTQRCNF